MIGMQKEQKSRGTELLSLSKKKEHPMDNYMYILRCRDGTLYTGWTNDLDRLLQAHQEGKGSKYTRARRPVALVYHERFDTKQEAMHREWEVKQLTRQEKLRLIGCDT